MQVLPASELHDGCEPLSRLGVSGKGVRLDVACELAPVLELAQECVAADEVSGAFRCDQPEPLHVSKRIQGRAFSHLGDLVAQDELKDLGGELHIADASRPAFEVVRPGVSLHASPHRDDLRKPRCAPTVAEAILRPHSFPSKFEFFGAENRARPDQRLQLPGLGVRPVVTLNRAHGGHQRPRSAVRAQTQVDPIQCAAPHPIGKGAVEHLAGLGKLGLRRGFETVRAHIH
ncbi:MAG: hypothetical protein CNCCGFBP_01175 [Fimbriimonadaceae bacterium]|nr:hypothetical protein [Fimbriimonadaceae bacterium]